MFERRKFARIPESAKITYEISNDPKAEHFLTKNISRGGVSFLAHEFIPKGTMLKIAFFWEKFSYDGFAKVAWTRKDSDNDRYETGVEFMNPPKTA